MSDDIIKVGDLELPRTIYEEIYNKGVDDGTKDTHKAHKSSLVSSLGGLLENGQQLKAQKKYDELVSDLGTMLSEKFQNLQQSAKDKIEPDEFQKQFEDAKVQWQTETDKKIKELDSKYQADIFKQRAINIASQKNLDPEYEDEFLTNLNKFQYDPSDEAYPFRDSEGKPVITDKAEPADLKYVINTIAEKKPIFFKKTNPGAGTRPGGPVISNDWKKEDFNNTREGLRESGLLKGLDKI